MKCTAQALPEVLLLEPRVFGDSRGYFLESYSTRSFPESAAATFVQDNISFSAKNVLRGLHLQNPNAQGKLVMAVSGSIIDVAVDVRVGSPRFGKSVAVQLNAETHEQLYIPPGFAHGFCVLSETAHVMYKCTALYAPGCEMSIRFDDPQLGIEWPTQSPILSAKDAEAPLLSQIDPSTLPQFEGE